MKTQRDFFFWIDKFEYLLEELFVCIKSRFP